MMKMTLVFVPPGGGEADYSLDFDLPAVPQKGDYITIRRPETVGTYDFIVRRTWWTMDYPDNKMYRSSDDTTTGTLAGIMVECEEAIGPYSSEEHKRGCPPETPHFDISCY